ncbi:MAG: UDPGP type 1 family protein [Clostridia bacterium]|nr:UDPGP type 1 family protein [Clostridia bacterium]
MISFNKAQEVLIKYNQQHVLNFYNELSDNEKEKLLEQIENINFEEVNNIYKEVAHVASDSVTDITPIGRIDKQELSDEELDRYIKHGEESIKNGRLAFVTMAGGQGTRLGHSGPKGTFVLDIQNNKSLFEILCDTLKIANNKYEVSIPWYIMTSRENNDETVKFFEDNNYFGYNKEDIIFFKQGELPMIFTDGKVVMEDKGIIRQAADGHGGIFRAMMKNNILQDMKNRNIKWIFIGGVDNCLLKMVDPLFIGICEEKGYTLGSKTIPKRSPDEKVGVFCKKNGKPAVVEYTEITEEMANLRDAKGELVYGEAHILCNMFSLDILEKMEKVPLKYHSAFKSTNYIDNYGKLCVSEKPNSYKFEALIFDAFGLADDVLLLRTKREDEFAPLKNKEGQDSIETARQLYYDYIGG